MLRHPKWVISAVSVVLLAAVFVRLGIWQLDRLDQRRTTNAIGTERIEASPVDLFQALDDTMPEDLEYRHVTVTGEFATDEEVLIRSQTYLGSAGFHVITPLVSDDGAVLVNRGWVPLGLDVPPVEQAAPAGGEVTVEGWVHLTQTRGAIGPVDAPGHLDVFNRVDVGRIQEQVTALLAPVYVVAMGERSDSLPVPVSPPDFQDEGPHLSYALQWFGFALIATIGFFFLWRRKGPAA